LSGCTENFVTGWRGHAKTRPIDKTSIRKRKMLIVNSFWYFDKGANNGGAKFIV
jgi:hypothetical protein